MAVDLLEDLCVCVDGRIILKCALNSTGEFGLCFVVQERDGWYVVLYMVLKFCEHGDQLTNSIKFGKFFEYSMTADVSGRTVLSVGLL
jgi:hypothetical protein